MDWTRAGLAASGFVGFVPFTDLPNDPAPTGPGVYLVVRPDDAPPVFLQRSVGGWIKGRDPTVDVGELERAWIPAAAVLYIGKASAGGTQRRGLRKRLDEYRRYGNGRAAPHRGGRYIWQLRDSGALLVAWRETVERSPGSAEAWLLDDFRRTYGATPFANRKLGDRPET